jgi:NitT/TauT family transport system substrate-binding protein
MRHIVAFLIVVGLIAGGTPAQRSEGAPAPEKTTLSIGTSVRDIGFLNVYVADAKGFFKNEGLAVKLLYFRGSGEAVPALAGGAVDLLADSFTTAIDAYVAGQPLKAIWSVSNIPAYQIYARREIKTVQDLRGKKIAVSGIGALSHLITIYMLQRGGLSDADRSVQYLAVGGPNDRLAALRAGRVDAIPSTVPGSYLLEEEGYTQLLDLRHLVKEFQYESLTAKNDFVNANPNTVRAVLRALIRAGYFIRRSPVESADILNKIINFPGAQRGLTVRAVSEVLADFPLDGHFAEGSVDVFLGFYKQMGHLKTVPRHDAIIDYRFIREFEEHPVHP